jgi:hypothetical protein
MLANSTKQEKKLEIGVLLSQSNVYIFLKFDHALLRFEKNRAARKQRG